MSKRCPVDVQKMLDGRLEDARKTFRRCPEYFQKRSEMSKTISKIFSDSRPVHIMLLVDFEVSRDYEDFSAAKSTFPAAFLNPLSIKRHDLPQ